MDYNNDENSNTTVRAFAVDNVAQDELERANAFQDELAEKMWQDYRAVLERRRERRRMLN